MLLAPSLRLAKLHSPARMADSSNQAAASQSKGEVESIAESDAQALAALLAHVDAALARSRERKSTITATDDDNSSSSSGSELGGMSSKRRRKAHVTLTWAQSLDACIGLRDTSTTSTARTLPLSISGAESMRFTHELRARHSAILVGIGTLIADDPSLSARAPPLPLSSSTAAAGGIPQPRPCVLDAMLRATEDRKLVRQARERRTVIFHSNEAPVARRDALQACGCTLVEVPRRRHSRLRRSRTEKVKSEGQLDLSACAEWLAANGHDSLMVEGGASVIADVLQSHETATSEGHEVRAEADLVAITVAPKFVGRDGVRLPLNGLVRLVIYTASIESVTDPGSDTHRSPRWSIDFRRSSDLTPWSCSRLPRPDRSVFHAILTSAVTFHSRAV